MAELNVIVAIGRPVEEKTLDPMAASLPANTSSGEVPIGPGTIPPPASIRRSWRNNHAYTFYDYADTIKFSGYHKLPGETQEEFQALYDEDSERWEPHGFLVSPVESARESLRHYTRVSLELIRGDKAPYAGPLPVLGRGTVLRNDDTGRFIDYMTLLETADFRPVPVAQRFDISPMAALDFRPGFTGPNNNRRWFQTPRFMPPPGPLTPSALPADSAQIEAAIATFNGNMDSLDVDWELGVWLRLTGNYALNTGAPRVEHHLIVFTDWRTWIYDQPVTFDIRLTRKPQLQYYDRQPLGAPANAYWGFAEGTEFLLQDRYGQWALGAIPGTDGFSDGRNATRFLKAGFAHLASRHERQAVVTMDPLPHRGIKRADNYQVISTPYDPFTLVIPPEPAADAPEPERNNPTTGDRDVYSYTPRWARLIERNTVVESETIGESGFLSRAGYRTTSRFRMRPGNLSPGLILVDEKKRVTFIESISAVDRNYVEVTTSFNSEFEGP